MTNPKGMRLNVHDIEFLRNVGIYGLLTAEDALYSYPGYKDNSVQKRLRLLSQNGYLRAAQLAVAFGHGGASGGGGRLPSLYSLTPAGADLLESTTGERPARVLNSDIAPSTYMHRREISEVVQIFTRSCLSAGLPMPRWVLEQDVWKSAPLNLPPNQRRYLYHAMSIGNKRFVCQPDIACLLQLPSSPVVLYWEIDRSTEGRKQLREPAKTDAYLTLMGTQGFQRYWPDVPSETFQFVFWVCPTPERLESLQQVFKDHEISKYMRLSHRRVFTADTNVVTSPIWQTIDGEWRPIWGSSHRQTAGTSVARHGDERPLAELRSNRRPNRRRRSERNAKKSCASRTNS
ncbi:MAG: hypothetical protein U0936_28045 [Planctomycetaceae bacterium]